MNRLLVSASCFIVLSVSTVPVRASVFLGKSQETWRKELSNRDASVRRSAAFALGRMGEEARGAVSQLVRLLLEDQNAGVRGMAASAIGDIARALKDNNEAVWNKSGGTLVQLLKNDPSEQVRRSAAYALGAFGPQAAGATEDLIKALGDDKASVRQNAAWALGRISAAAGDAVTKLSQCLRDKDALVRRDAAEALGSLGKAGAKAGRPLIELAKSEPDTVVKKTALASLVRIAGPEQADAAKDLVPLLEDKDPKIRLDAALVLTRIGGEESANALSVLRSALKDSDPDNQESAAAALATLGPPAKPAMHDLADTLTDAKKSVLVRSKAALAICHIGPAAKPVVPALVKALQRSQPQEVRLYAAEALSQIRYPANEKGIPAILDAIENEKDADVRLRCTYALFRMEQSDFKESGAEKLLTKVLDERGPKMALVRYNAARKIAQILRDQAPDKTADVLLEMLTNTSLLIYHGTDAKVEGASTEATASRTKMQENFGGDARYLAVEALAWLGDKAAKRPEVVEALRKAAKEKDAKLRRSAEETMKILGIKE
ncbi:MAG TPA: HEAT repeat domain-containing protein [Gemmataceae bacterium]|nr:HEAT repeat domain-containing protein [Gemmataceae bacterium]